MPVEFGPAGPDLSQGDLIELAPSNYVDDLGYLVKFSDNPARFQLRSVRPQHMHDDKTHQANARGVRVPGIVLTHDCEIDKDDRERASILVGLVRPLKSLPDEHQDGIRRYTRHRAFYLPVTEPDAAAVQEEGDGANGEAAEGGDTEPQIHLAEECYLDLRRITSIRRGALEQLERKAAMNEDGRLMLQEHLFRFFTRRLLPDGWREWESEE